MTAALSAPEDLDPRQVARAVRCRVLRQIIDAGGGYLSQAFSSADILATLYTRVMRLGPSQGPPVPGPFAGVPGPNNPAAHTGAAYHGPREPHLDRFFFSPAHYALALYCTLIEVGRLAPEALDAYNQDGSSVELIAAEHSPGIEAMPGSLPQALSQAGGVALGRRLKGETGRTWVFMSDGELQEGQFWEAINALAFHHLEALGIYVDVNGQQCDGPMERVMTVSPAAERLRAFGATVCEVDGHDVEALAAAAVTPREGGPLVVLARTDPCREVDLLRRRTPKLHYLRFRDEAERDEYRALLKSMEEG